MPPSPVVRSLRGWNENVASAAPTPTGRPRHVDPAAQAASSITVMPRGSQSARIASRSAGTPAWSTRMTARVRPLRCGSTVCGMRFCEARSTSAKTGVAPTYRTALAVAMNDSDGTITSSPGAIPAAIRARCRAVVQEDTATAWGEPIAVANASSNSRTRGPCAIQPDATASAAASASSLPSHGFMTGII